MEELLGAGAGIIGGLISGAIQKHGTPIPNNAIPFTNPVAAVAITWKATGDAGTTAAVGAGALGATAVHQFGKWALRKWRKRSKLP
jgi:hypothetical protein